MRTSNASILPMSPNDDASSPPVHLTGKVYVASPLTTYQTPRYDCMCATVRTLFPHADVLPARGLFASNAGWRARWPALLPTLAAVVFFTDDAGWIGKGVWAEISGAAHAGVPVALLTDGGSLYDIGSLAFHVDEDDWRQYAHVQPPLLRGGQ